jgi:hypothetical protein
MASSTKNLTEPAPARAVVYVLCAEGEPQWAVRTRQEAAATVTNDRGLTVLAACMPHAAAVGDTLWVPVAQHMGGDSVAEPLGVFHDQQNATAALENHLEYVARRLFGAVVVARVHTVVMRASTG